MTDFQSLYNRLVVMYPNLANIPVKQTIAFARFIERVTLCRWCNIIGDSAISSYAPEYDWAISGYNDGEMHRLAIIDSHRTFCEFHRFRPMASAMQLAIVMHILAHQKKLTKYGRRMIPYVGNLAESTEAYVCIHRRFGKDLANEIGVYLWAIAPAPDSRIGELKKMTDSFLVSMTFNPFGAYPDDYMAALRINHPNVNPDAFAEHIEQRIGPDGRLISLGEWKGKFCDSSQVKMLQNIDVILHNSGLI